MFKEQSGYFHLILREMKLFQSNGGHSIKFFEEPLMGLTTFLLKIMWKPNYWSYCYEILHE